MDSKQIMEVAVKCIDSKKGGNIKVLDVAGLTSMADYFIICQGNSTTQMKAISDEVMEKLSECGVSPRGREGISTAYWILLDYSDVVIHIFSPESREFYSIDNLWSDAKTVDISDIVIDE